MQSTNYLKHGQVTNESANFWERKILLCVQYSFSKSKKISPEATYYLLMSPTLVFRTCPVHGGLMALCHSTVYFPWKHGHAWFLCTPVSIPIVTYIHIYLAFWEFFKLVTKLSLPLNVWAFIWFIAFHYFMWFFVSCKHIKCEYY